MKKGNEVGTTILLSDNHLKILYARIDDLEEILYKLREDKRESSIEYKAIEAAKDALFSIYLLELKPSKMEIVMRKLFSK